jgi:UDP-glucose 4-epimerase
MSRPRIQGREIVITGGAGFIGSHLADALVEDNDVTVVDDLSTGDRDHVPADATFVEANVENRDAVADCIASADVAFHQAAQISVDQSIETPVQSHRTNVDATLELLELARLYDVRLVLASSCAIYGDPESVPVPETARLDPRSPYGLEKATVDRYARLYHDLYGVETVALRYFNVYGPRQSGGDYSGVIDVFLEQARNGDPLTVHGDGSQTRDFVHVSDVVRANCLAATTDHVGEAFNVGTGQQTSIEKLAAVVRDLTDSSSSIRHTEPREGDIRQSQADTRKSAERLGCTANRELVEGLGTLVEE